MNENKLGFNRRFSFDAIPIFYIINTNVPQNVFEEKGNSCPVK